MPRFRAPGRVNLIGGQVDYHEGFVVSVAVDRDVVVDARPRTDGRVVASSDDLAGVVDVAADGTDDPASIRPAWGRLVGGVLRVLAAAGRAPVGADLATSSTVPVGAGLSSSAAFEVAVARALGAAAGFELSDRELALACQQAEHIALGVPCGIQDQMTSVMARAGHALLLDCRTLEVEHVAIPDEIGIVVVHSGVSRTLEGSAWSTRRAESFAVAESLGLSVLRDATPGQVAGFRRGRHVVSEIARVQAFAAALRAADPAALGALLLASHASSRDDMEVSIPELDTLVECLVGAGAYGARLTGGGFGGCVVALAPAASAEEVSEQASSRYRARTGCEPTPWIVTAAGGATGS